MTLHLQKAPKKPTLYSYFRSTAAYRVRIVLNLKGVDHDIVPVNLRDGEQGDDSYKQINPQGLVPTLKVYDQVISQSLAIIDYLESIYPEPALFLKDPFERAKVLEISHLIAMDIHPLNNLRVLNYLTNELKIGEDKRLQWYKHWLALGLTAVEEKLKKVGGSRQFCYGSEVSLADVCLIPQVYNALRYECDVTEYKTIMGIYEFCLSRPEFSKARPEAQEDAI